VTKDGAPKPWFRYTLGWYWFAWWPSHWKGCLLMLIGLPIVALGFFIAFALVFSGHPLIGLIVGGLIAGPIQWVGIQHAESVDDPPRVPVRKFRDDE
jgi:hypothetical protein